MRRTRTVRSSADHRSTTSSTRSFLAVDVARRTVYAVSESAEQGLVVAYRRSPIDGSLERLGVVSSHGSAPCHVSIDDDLVHVANYGSGSVASYLVRLPTARSTDSSPLDSTAGPGRIRAKPGHTRTASGLHRAESRSMPPTSAPTAS